jgi:transcriptional regulator with GAF, ATPase, and Fis domain
MSADNWTMDTQALLVHWQAQLQTNPQYRDITDRETAVITRHANAFLKECIQVSQSVLMTDSAAITTLLAFLRSWRSPSRQDRLSIREITLMILSLKSSLTDYITRNPASLSGLKGLNDVLDWIGLMVFELYSHEQETIIAHQSEQITYLTKKSAFGQIIGESNAMKTVYQAIGLVLDNDVNVLLQGESGTGKDVIATVIHTHSKRKKYPFVTVNCGAIPEHLIESEFFGHERGAFTGADTRRIGKFELANNGTLFLDEISELNLSQQTTLLRVLQNNEIQRVGGNDTIPIDVRIIAASNKPLEDLVASNQFRLDLFYRINVFPIFIPRLADRGTDIIVLAHHFIDKYSATFGIPKATLTPSAEQYLMHCDWPGNIRELENTIQRAVIISHGKPITEAIFQYTPGKRPLASPLLLPEPGPQPFTPITLADHEANAIRQSLAYFNGNMKKTAQSLGISRTTLYNKCDHYGIHITKASIQN